MIHRPHPVSYNRPDDKLGTRLAYLAALVVGMAVAMVVTALVMASFQ